MDSLYNKKQSEASKTFSYIQDIIVIDKKKISGHAKRQDHTKRNKYTLKTDCRKKKNRLQVN